MKKRKFQNAKSGGMGTMMNMRVRMRRGMEVGNEDEREWCWEWKKLRGAYREIEQLERERVMEKEG